MTDSKVKELNQVLHRVHHTNFLTEQIEEYSEARREDQQLDRVLFGARSPEELATGLVKSQIRRDESRQSDIEKVKLLEEGQSISEHFADAFIKAAQDLEEPNTRPGSADRRPHLST